MKFITLKGLHQNTSLMLKDLSNNDFFVVTYRGKPYAIMQSISEDKLEDFIFQNSRYIRKKIEKGLEDIRKGRTISLDKSKEKIFGKRGKTSKSRLSS